MIRYRVKRKADTTKILTTAQKMKLPVKDFFIFCAVEATNYLFIYLFFWRGVGGVSLSLYARPLFCKISRVEHSPN